MSGMNREARAGGLGLTPAVGWLAWTSGLYLLLVMTPRLRPVYHPDVPNLGADLCGFLIYQIVLLSLLMTARPGLRRIDLVLVPPVAALIFKLGVVNLLAVAIHGVLDGPWLGVETQDVPFDKGNSVINLLFLTSAVLFAFHLAPHRRSWDRSMVFLLGMGMVLVTAVYHIIIYATLWHAVSGPVAGLVEAIEAEVLERGLPSDETGCPRGEGLVCFVFGDGEPFPEHALFSGNAAIHLLAEEHNALAPFAMGAIAPIGSDGGTARLPRVDLRHSSIDDTHQPIHLRRGFLVNAEGRSMLLYWDAETRLIAVLANAIAMASSTFMLAWLFATIALSGFHARMRRPAPGGVR